MNLCGSSFCHLKMLLILALCTAWNLSGDTFTAYLISSLETVTHCLYFFRLLLFKQRFIQIMNLFTVRFRNGKSFRKQMEKLFTKACSDRTRAVVLKWRKVGLDWIWGRNSLLWEWWDIGTVWPEKLWMSYRQKCLELDWMGL